jgi:hypothetical protein
LFELGKPIVQEVRDAILSGKRPYPETLDKLYPAFSAGIPNHMGVAIPVSGNDLVLPEVSTWKEAVNGSSVIVGRNPYDSMKLQPISKEHVHYSDDLSKIQALQYTLTGYTRNDVTNDPIGQFFKGMLAVIPDEMFPDDHRACDMLVSSKDMKLCQAWVNGNDKKEAQNSSVSLFYDLHGMLVVKQIIPGRHLAGIPLKEADKSGGDFDGDDYNIIQAALVPKLAQMIEEYNSEQIVNPKLKKTDTPRNKVGNYAKIVDLCLPILPKWIAIINAIYAMSQEQRKAFAHALFEDEESLLGEVLGEDWSSKLGIPKDNINEEIILMAEIQLGIKCGEDAPKTKVPMSLVYERALFYEHKLSEMGYSLAEPYGKGLKKRIERLKKRFEQTPHVTLEECIEILNPQPLQNKKMAKDMKIITTASPQSSTKSHNIVGKSYRALFRFLSNDSSSTQNEDGYISDDHSAGAERLPARGMIGR